MILHFEAAIFGGMYNNDGINQTVFTRDIQETN